MVRLGIIFLALSVFKSGGRVMAADRRSKKPAIEVAKTDYNQGNYAEALTLAIQVYQVARSSQDERMAADAGNLIGLVYLSQGRTRSAEQYFRDAAGINKKLKNYQRLSANLLNISLARSDDGQTDSAIFFVKQSLILSQQFKLNNLIAMGRNHLGDFLRKKGRLKEAEQEFQTVLTNQDYQSNWERSLAFTGLARVKFDRNSYREAGRLADQAYLYAIRADARWDAAQALGLAEQAYYKMGDTGIAYQRLKSFKAYNDSLFNSGKQKIIERLLLKEKLTENDSLLKAIRLAEQQRKIDRLVIALISIAVLTAVLLAGILYRRSLRTYRANRTLRLLNDVTLSEKKHVEKENESLSKLNRHKDRLFAIISHDLRGPFATISSTLQLFKAKEMHAEELVTLSDQLADQIQAASGMLDSLLVWADSQLTGMSRRPADIRLTQKVERVVAVLKASAARKKITLHHQSRDLPIVLGDPDQVRIIIQNLVANAIKFTNAYGAVDIFYELRDGLLILSIQDSGIGMSTDMLDKILNELNAPMSTYGTANEKGSGLGLRLVKEFAAANQITLQAESLQGKGTTFRLGFRIAE